VSDDGFREDLPVDAHDFDNALLEITSRHYYANRDLESAWYPGQYTEYLRRAAVLWERSLWRCHHQCRFLDRTRRHLRKHHSHYVAVVLTRRVCQGRLPLELSMLVQNFILSDADVAPVMGRFLSARIDL
jgi:hypothetical protein